MVNLKSTPILDYEYFRPSVAVDGVVFAMLENELNVLLIKRGAIEKSGKKRPFYNYWALPGGFMRSQETTTQSLTRELKEEAGLDLIKKSIKPHQLNVYSNPTRDSYNFDKNLPFEVINKLFPKHFLSCFQEDTTQYRVQMQLTQNFLRSKM